MSNLPMSWTNGKSFARKLQSKFGLLTSITRTNVNLRGPVRFAFPPRLTLSKKNKFKPTAYLFMFSPRALCSRDQSQGVVPLRHPCIQLGNQESFRSTKTWRYCAQNFFAWVPEGFRNNTEFFSLGVPQRTRFPRGLVQHGVRL